MAGLGKRDDLWVPSELRLFAELLSANASIEEMERQLHRSRYSINAKRHRMIRKPGERSQLSAQLSDGRQIAGEINARARWENGRQGIPKEDNPALVRVEALPPPPSALCIPLLELRDHQCYFPVGKGHAVFCGADTGEHPTYCAFHRDIVYQP